MPFPSETPRWRRYLRFWRRDVQADIEDELAFHFQTRISELTERGMTPDAARAKALEEFGDVTAVRHDLRTIDRRMERRERRTEWLDGWRQDLVYSARSLRRTPGVTITIVLTLALGLGANAAMFTVLNAVFLRPPGGVAAPHQVRRVWTDVKFRSGRQFWPGYDYQQYRAVAAAVRGLGSTTIYRHPEEVKVRRGTATLSARRSFASSDFFVLLGVRRAIGRFYTADEDRLGAPQRVVVASHAYWRRELDGDAAALGQTIRIDGIPHTLVGVSDARFSGVDLDATDLWVPLATLSGYGDKPWWLDSRVNGFQLLIRADDGVSDAALNARLTPALQEPEIQRSPASRNDLTRVGLLIRARGPGKLGQEVEIAKRLGGVAFIVLVIACANVVSLLMARAVRRRREIGMRLALGISRSRLARLVLTESVLLATLAGIGAILAAFWGGLALRSLLLPDIHWARSPLDWRVLAGAVAASIGAGIVAGIVPAVQSASLTLTDVLKSGARDGHVRRSQLRSSLVVAQVALSVMLLIGAMLFVRSLSNVRGLDLGFDADRLMFAHVSFESRDARRDSLGPARLAEAAERLRASPGVESAALASMALMSGFSAEAFYPDADTITHKKPWGMYWAVSPEYFTTTGTRIVAGAGFPDAPGATTPPVVIVNTAMADALWPGESPLGRCVRFESPRSRCNTIIGVVETTRWGNVIEEATPQFFLPLGNLPIASRPRALAVRAGAAMAPAVTKQIREVLSAVFPGGDPVVRHMTAVLEPHYRPWRLGATLFSMFGLLAGLVAALGVYSTVSYNVNQRTHEFGVRVALGAQMGDVVSHVLGRGLRAVMLGIVIGLGLSLAGGRLVAALLYGITPDDPQTFGVVGATLLAVATVAAFVPAWRASRVDPLVALRSE